MSSEIERAKPSGIVTTTDDGFGVKVVAGVFVTLIGGAYLISKSRSNPDQGPSIIASWWGK